MTLQTLAWSLGQVAIHYNPVNGYYGVSSIGQLDTTQLSYPAMALVPSGDMTQRKGYIEYNLTFYVVDRLLTDSANDFDVYSYSVETLKNYFKQLRLLPGVLHIDEEPTFRLFTTERGNDRVCGAYSTVGISVADDAPCADWLDPLGERTPDIDPTPQRPRPDITRITAHLADWITPGKRYIIFEDRNNGGLVRNFPDIQPYPSNYNSNLQIVYGCNIMKDGNTIEVTGSRINYVAVFRAGANEGGRGCFFDSQTFDKKHLATLSSVKKGDSYRIAVHNTGLEIERLFVTNEGKLYTENEYFGRHLTIGSTYDEVLGKTTVLFGAGEEIMYLYEIDEIEYAET